MTQGSDTTEQIMRDYVAWENGDSSKLEVISPSVDAYNPELPGGEVHSREEWKRYFDEIQVAFPDYEVQTTAEVMGESVAMHEVKITGTHRAEFKGIPATGREVEVRAMGKYLIGNGKVVEIHHFYDPSELQAQLGLTFSDIIGQLPKLTWGKIRTLG